MKRFILITMALCAMINNSYSQMKEEYTFDLSDKVVRQKVEFKNRYGITLVADMYVPKEKYSEKFSAIAVSGPF